MLQVCDQPVLSQVHVAAVRRLLRWPVSGLRVAFGRRRRAASSTQRREHVRLDVFEPLALKLLVIGPSSDQSPHQMDQSARRRHVMCWILAEQVHQQRRTAARKTGNKLEWLVDHGIPGCGSSFLAAAETAVK